MAWLALLWAVGVASAQQVPGDDESIAPTAESLAKERTLIADVLDPEITLELSPNTSKLLRTKRPVSRVSVIDQTIVEVTQYGANEMEIIGLKEGSTDLTLWFGDPQAGELQVLRYRVRVGVDMALDRRRRLEYSELESMINELFPNSSIELIVVADKLIVRGQARDAEEAANILAMLRRQSQLGGINAAPSVSQGAAATPFPGSDTLPTTNLISMLRVPGEQQVLLKVRVAEITRTALRELGLDFAINKGGFSLTSSFGNAGNITALLDANDVNLLLRAVATNAYSKVLAEPNLVTLSGRPASFIAGGQFAVPTTVGIQGAQAAATFFQGFGTQLRFIPTVLDKDRIRLTVAPTFSTINRDNTVNGIPGLNTRSALTTVDMREGQWLALAGLLQDQQNGSRTRVPVIGDIPVLSVVFGRNRIQREESELLILVSPQLVHALEPEKAPQLLPGMEVGEPTDLNFYGLSQIEGPAGIHHRSTVWPSDRAAITRAVRQSKTASRYRQAQRYFLASPYGFSE